MRGRLKAYLAVVATVGLALLALLATTVDVERLRADPVLIASLSVFVLVGPQFAVPLSRDGRGPTVHVDAPFAFALVLFGGVGVAALVIAASVVLYDLPHRKPLPKLTFNAGAHTLGVAGGAGVWMLLGGGQAVSRATLPAILAGTAVFVAVKFVLVAIAVSLDESVRPDLGPLRILGHAVVVTVMTQVVVLVIVLAAGQAMMLLLAFALVAAAFLTLRSEAKANLGRNEAERTARREAELRAQEHELRLQQQEVTRKLQETDQMKDDLLAMVSHELRTPLTTVVGALRLLSAGAPLSPDERQEMLEMADRQARRLRSLIEQLLLAAQSERGDPSYPSSASELVEADAAELVVQAATEARAGSCRHPIIVRCDGGLPVRLAPDAILQILGNLIDNACKYSPDDRQVWLVAERDRGSAVLAVEDDGAGVPPAERERIFERFTRVGSGRGLGLGLYIARELARAQGGDLLLADARHAAGARFELRLPLRQGAGPPADPTLGSSGGGTDAETGRLARHQGPRAGPDGLGDGVEDQRGPDGVVDGRPVRPAVADRP